MEITNQETRIPTPLEHFQSVTRVENRNETNTPSLDSRSAYQDPVTSVTSRVSHPDIGLVNIDGNIYLTVHLVINCIFVFFENKKHKKNIKINYQNGFGKSGSNG